MNQCVQFWTAYRHSKPYKITKFNRRSALLSTFYSYQVIPLETILNKVVVKIYSLKDTLNIIFAWENMINFRFVIKLHKIQNIFFSN